MLLETVNGRESIIFVTGGNGYDERPPEGETRWANLARSELIVSILKYNAIVPAGENQGTSHDGLGPG